eukprot:TRINITY_DN5969_c0_g2_i1.p1 TRINITY_DN5969_c0_g2~~TRINITY_DN5969_c0_g2_i1.p1  ORF type:complete len:472 (-),score=49.66 TRINITY_DN5969_c0_g2_i1:60-1424(-)
MQLSGIGLFPRQSAVLRPLLFVMINALSARVTSAALRRTPSAVRSVDTSAHPRRVTLKDGYGVANADVAAKVVRSGGARSLATVGNGTFTGLSRAATADLFAAAVNSTNNGSQRQPLGQSLRPPRIYFLFLAVDKVSNLDIWRYFFGQADPNQYRAFVHCKNPSCVHQTMGSPLITVPTVPSFYCTDLVSPMNQLLSVALNSDVDFANPLDKFTFISDSTLPAKPFSHIYSTLTSRQGSDFCVFPSAEWADIPGSAGLEIAVKHHQWITLDRNHAERASWMWAQGSMHDFMVRFHMNANGWSYGDNAFADGRNFGCLDEFWFMLAIFGPLTHSTVGSEQSVHLPTFTGSPLHISTESKWQGACDTFVLWSQYLHRTSNSAFDRLYMSMDPASVPYSGNAMRPGWWDRLSSAAMVAVRNSEFLFVRKFVDLPLLADVGGNSEGFQAAYMRIVFGV